MTDNQPRFSSGELLLFAGTLTVLAAGSLRATVIESPLMLIPAFVGLLVALIGAVRA